MRWPVRGAPEHVLPRHVMIDPATAALLVDRHYSPEADAEGRIIGMHVRDYSDVVSVPAWLFSPAGAAES